MLGGGGRGGRGEVEYVLHAEGRHWYCLCGRDEVEKLTYLMYYRDLDTWGLEGEGGGRGILESVILPKVQCGIAILVLEQKKTLESLNTHIYIIFKILLSNISNF